MSILKFSTPGCSPCYALSVLLDEMMVDYDDIDITKDVEAAITHRIRSVPTLVDTVTNARLSSFTSRAAVEAWLDDNQS
jgi:glutaredoxin